MGDFEPAEIVALLSCFVYEGRTQEEEPPLITPRLEKGRQKDLGNCGKAFEGICRKTSFFDTGGGRFRGEQNVLRWLMLYTNGPTGCHLMKLCKLVLKQKVQL